MKKKSPPLKLIKLSQESVDSRHTSVNECLEEVKALCEEEGYDNVFIFAFRTNNDTHSWARRSAGKDVQLTRLLGFLELVKSDLIEESTRTD